MLLLDYIQHYYPYMYQLYPYPVNYVAIKLCTILFYNLLHTAGSLDAMKDLVAESAIMKTFHHPNVLPLLGVCTDYDDEDMLKIILPFMANGDMRTFLKNNRVTPSNTSQYSNVSSNRLQVYNNTVVSNWM